MTATKQIICYSPQGEKSTTPHRTTQGSTRVNQEAKEEGELWVKSFIVVSKGRSGWGWVSRLKSSQIEQFQPTSGVVWLLAPEWLGQVDSGPEYESLIKVVGRVWLWITIYYMSSMLLGKPMSFTFSGIGYPGRHRMSKQKQKIWLIYWPCFYIIFAKPSRAYTGQKQGHFANV